MYKIEDVSSMDLAFGCNAMQLMPSYDKIPDNFKHGSTEWNKLVSAWFFCGLSKLEIKSKDGVDKNKALRHIKTILGSFEPPHEHKEAGVAFLMSEWFESVKWEAKPFT